MKRVFLAMLFVAVSIGLVWALQQAFPKNTGALSLFLVFLFLDAYLWVESWNRLKRLDKPWRILLVILYWSPMALVIAGVCYGFLSTFYDWPLFVKSYLTSFVLIAYISKCLPVSLIITGRLLQGLQYALAWMMDVALRGKVRIRYFLVSGWTLGLLLFGLLMTGMIFWEHDFRIRQTEVVLEELPPSFDGLRIVQISDLHLGTWNRKTRLEELVQLVNSLHPDLFFYTGDICNYTTEEAWPFSEILRQVNSVYGNYTILGNHDYGDYMHWPTPQAKEENLQDLVRFYREIGWNLLRNESVILHKENDSLAIIGVENWGLIRRFQRLADLPSALTGTEGIPTKLLLSHDPTYWDSIVSRQYPGIDITFSGHTHGGQIGFETETVCWGFVQYVYPRWAGLYIREHPGRGRQYLYVNRGAGTIGYAGRLGIWAEVTLVVLKGGKNSSPV